MSFLPPLETHGATTQLLPALPESGGRMGAACFPAGLAAGKARVGHTQSQRSPCDFGMGRQREAAKNRLKGSADVCLCSIRGSSMADLLGATFPHWQYSQAQSCGMLGHHHLSTIIPEIGIPESKSGSGRAREGLLQAGATPSCSRELLPGRRVGARENLGTAGTPWYCGDSAPPSSPGIAEPCRSWRAQEGGRGMKQE